MRYYLSMIPLVFLLLCLMILSNSVYGNTCERRYVDPDPSRGSNNNPGTLNAPFRTLNYAMGVAPDNSVIILLPGKYYETWPLMCKSGISIQGTNALDTVLMGNGSDVLHFEASQNNDYSHTNYDGFSICKADNCIYLYGELYSSKPTFSNMFLVDSNGGIAMKAIDLQGYGSPDDRDDNDFVEHRPKIVNVTIADNDNYGIHDINAEAEPAILNCLIWRNAKDLLRVDVDDIFSSVFETFSGPYKRGPGAAPISIIPPPQLSVLSPDSVYINRKYDYRLLPGAPMIDLGVNPTNSVQFHEGGTTIYRKGPCNVDIWDVDCEGYFNINPNKPLNDIERVENGVIDIGADELGQLIISDYIPYTRSFGTSGNTTYNQMTLIMTPQPALSADPLTIGLYYSASSSPYNYQKWWPVNVPGARGGGTLTTPVSLSFGNVCITLDPLYNVTYTAQSGVPFTIQIPLPPPLGDYETNFQAIALDSSNPPKRCAMSNLQTVVVKN